MRPPQDSRRYHLLLSPNGTNSDYYRPERAAKREQLQQHFRDALLRDIAWQQDIFVTGPPLEALHKACDGAGFFHVEMFQALPGKRQELIHQREMENAYSHQLHLPENLIFVRDQGADVDSFTIGCYPDLKHYAQASDISPAAADAANTSAAVDSAPHVPPHPRPLA